MVTATVLLRSLPLEVGLLCLQRCLLCLLALARFFVVRCLLYYMHLAPLYRKVLLLVDTKTRAKRDAPATGGRPGSAVTRDSTFGRPEREAPRRDRALRDSWQASPGLGSSSSSYRPAAASRGSRAPPERLASDNGRSNLDSRDTFGPSTSSSSTSRGVFRTQSGPPLRDREDFGFGSSTSGYNDGLAFKPNAPRGTAVRSSLEKVISKCTSIMRTILPCCPFTLLAIPRVGCTPHLSGFWLQSALTSVGCTQYNTCGRCQPRQCVSAGINTGTRKKF